MRFLILVFAVSAFGASISNAATLTRYALVLSDPPAAAAGNRPAQEVARLRNIDAHAAVRARLRVRGIPIASESAVLLNAIFVNADNARLSDLQAIPGVRYVARVPRFHRSLDRAIQLINVPAAWTQLGGTANAGAGVRIAIIDTGIANAHPAFQDSTLTAPAGYPVCSIAQQPFTPLDCTQFTNSKVIVARSYVPLIAAGSGPVPAATSRPDDVTPRDHSGHGTAVAMAAAGATNTGPADTITGVAPKAFLGSYKVFGSPGLNDFTSADAIVAALEDAYYNDSMDIAVLALGAPALFGPQDTGSTCGAPNGIPCDPEAAAVQNAVNAGMIVVAAAGNEGPTPNSIDSPADAAGAIAVGAITNSHNWSNPLTVAGLGTFHSLLGAGPSPNASLNAPLADATIAGDPYACNTLTPNSLSGAYALVLRGTCTFATKVQNVQAAGAAGAVVINNPGDDSVIAPGGLNGVTGIPAALIGYDDGQAILNALPATASMNPALAPFDVAAGGQLAEFSSQGPSITGALKPDIYAVGTNLYLAGQSYDAGGDLFSPSGYLVSQGTSFATPQIAGIAALVKQNNSKLTPAQIQSAVVNTQANAAAALTANIVAAPTSASFGVITAARLPATQAIQLTNTSNAAVTLSLALDQSLQPIPEPALDKTTLTLAAGQTGTVNISLSGSLPAPGLYRAFLTATGGATPVRIPYMYLVGSGTPWNLVPLAGNNDDGTAGQATSQGSIIVQLTDQYGVPVPNAPVTWTVASGGGSLQFADALTNMYGLAGAEPTLGPTPGLNDFFAVAGGLTTDFIATGLAQPTIFANGAVDAADFVPGRGVAPGSYVALFGNNLAALTETNTTQNLPVSLGPVSVSFDTATSSLPGHLAFATPGQINVQVPWELQGQQSAQIKVSVQDSAGKLYQLPISPYSPGIFAIVDENGNLVTQSNPALQGHNITIYCNGLGPVTNQPASGDPSPSSPLARTIATPIVTIGTQTASLLFSGLTPTTVGLYQLNVTVPATGSGAKTIGISVGGVNSKTSNIVIQ